MIAQTSDEIRIAAISYKPLLESAATAPTMNR